MKISTLSEGTAFMRSARAATIIALFSAAFACQSLQAQQSPDLAALDRYVAAAVRDCPGGEVTITATLDGGSALVAITGGDDAWRTESAAALGAFRATVKGSHLTLRLRRTPLRAV